MTTAGNPLVNLWRGDISLLSAYWGYGVVGGLVWTIPLSLVAPGSAAAISFVLLFAAYIVATNVGIWRSAGKYQGAKVWAKLAKFTVAAPAVLLVVGTILAIALPAYQQRGLETSQNKPNAIAPKEFWANDRAFKPDDGSKPFSYEDATQPLKESAADSVNWADFTPTVQPVTQPTPNTPSIPILSEREKNEIQTQADLKKVADRAVSDYPYLNTPAGAPVMERIIERRDLLIQQGVHPPIALTRAVNAFAPAYAP